MYNNVYQFDINKISKSTFFNHRYACVGCCALPGAKQCIEATLPRPPPGPVSPSRRRVTSKSRGRPEPDAEPPVDERPAATAPTAVAAVAPEELLGFGVVGGSDLPDTEEVSACMPLPTGEATGRVVGEGPHETYVGGIGRSAGAKISKSKVQAGYKKSESMRPDEATGKPGAKLEGSIMSTTTTTTDSATAAADQERLVSAAVAGEVDDVQQLLGRAGVRIDGLVAEGRHAKLTALMAAAARGRTEVVQVLLNRSHKQKKMHGTVPYGSMLFSLQESGNRCQRHPRMDSFLEATYLQLAVC